MCRRELRGLAGQTLHKTQSRTPAVRPPAEHELVRDRADDCDPEPALGDLPQAVDDGFAVVVETAALVTYLDREHVATQLVAHLDVPVSVGIRVPDRVR